MNTINKNKINMSNKNKTLLIGGLGILGLGGIFAYFTDTETKDNKFTVGNVDIQLIEDKWDKHVDANQNDIPDIAETITPLKSIDKDPLISNVGTNDAWVYMEVKIPLLKNIVVADIDGIKQPAGDVELFSFIKNEGWTEIGTKELDDTGENMVYVYGYNTALSSKQSTPTLFDTIKFANIIQGQGIETLEKSVVVTAKAIQTEGTGTMQEAYRNNFEETKHDDSTVNITIKNNEGYLMKNQKLIIKNDESEIVAEGFTDENGKFTCVVSKLGYYTVEVLYKANSEDDEETFFMHFQVLKYGDRIDEVYDTFQAKPGDIEASISNSTWGLENGKIVRKTPISVNASTEYGELSYEWHVQAFGYFESSLPNYSEELSFRDIYAITDIIELEQKTNNIITLEELEKIKINSPNFENMNYFYPIQQKDSTTKIISPTFNPNAFDVSGYVIIKNTKNGHTLTKEVYFGKPII